LAHSPKWLDFLGFICHLPLFSSLIAASKCKTLLQAFLLSVRGENNVAANLNSKANINTARTHEGLQVETAPIDQQHNHENNSQSLFHKHFLRTTQNFSGSSSSGPYIGLLANSRLTIHWHTCGSSA